MAHPNTCNTNKIRIQRTCFFKQGRPGIDENEFFCYKLRSMKINQTTEKEGLKTIQELKIGKFGKRV
jgi:putative colanic acid biosynthesis UDP-glucose lipid carrier transferase